MNVLAGVAKKDARSGRGGKEASQNEKKPSLLSPHSVRVQGHLIWQRKSRTIFNVLFLPLYIFQFT